MALPVVYRRKVGRDLAGGFGYYEGQGEDLGEKFLAAVDSAFDAIERYPEMFSRVHGEVRRAVDHVLTSLTLLRFSTADLHFRGRPIRLR